MLRISCIILIRKCHEQGLINKKRKDELEEYVMNDKVHSIIRNLLMMVLIPRKLHVDDESQAAYLRAAVSRVRSILKNYYLFVDCQSDGDAVKGTRLFATNLGDDLLR